MSVPGRIGIILILAFGLIDGIILASGAHRAAVSLESRAVVAEVSAAAETGKRDCLITDVIERIAMRLTKPAPGAPSGI